MSRLFEAKWEATKKALLDIENFYGPTLPRKTIIWHEENTRKQNMSAVIYSKHPCPFCDRAKMLFNHKGIGYTEINAIENMDDMVKKVTEATGSPPATVPQIWLDGKYIGGFNQLVEHFKNQA